MAAKRIKIIGSVQGVFFRANAKEKAEELELIGWVKNCPDGSVETHAEGSPESISEFEQWCSHGPQTAIVESVKSEDTREAGYESFEIVR